MQRTISILKYLLLGFLALVIVWQLFLIAQYGHFGGSETLLLLVPLFFIMVLFPSRKFIWLIALAVSVFGMVDIYYLGSYSATPPKMMFTLPLVFYFKEIHWLKRLLEIIPALFYPAAFIILLLPGVRRKYFTYEK